MEHGVYCIVVNIIGNVGLSFQGTLSDFLEGQNGNFGLNSRQDSPLAVYYLQRSGTWEIENNLVNH